MIDRNLQHLSLKCIPLLPLVATPSHILVIQFPSQITQAIISKIMLFLTINRRNIYIYIYIYIYIFIYNYIIIKSIGKITKKNI